MRRVATIAILACLATVLVLVAFAAKPDGVAIVDGVVISRATYDQYAQVFTSPDGTVRVSEEDVLLSLVNQVLVQREAQRRGIEVSDDEVAREVGGMSETDLIARSLPKGGEEAAFRERVRMFVLFRLVKAEVVGPVQIPDDLLEAAYATDPSLHVLAFSDAVLVLRERLTTRESDSRWVSWLTAQRACVVIRILDTTFDIPSSTPTPGCVAADG